MNLKTRIAVVSLLAGSSLVSSTGCTSLEESYAGRDTHQVWTAMVAVAENPDYYHDWIITQNNVWASEDQARIEIHRTLERDHIVPLARPHHETKTWKHQILLMENEDGPLIKFTSRDWAVPMHARDEALMFFADVWDILGGAPDPVMSSDDDEDHGEGMDEGAHHPNEGAHEEHDDGTVDVDDVNE